MSIKQYAISHNYDILLSSSLLVVWIWIMDTQTHRYKRDRNEHTNLDTVIKMLIHLHRHNFWKT